MKTTACFAALALAACSESATTVASPDTATSDTAVLDIAEPTPDAEPLDVGPDGQAPDSGSAPAQGYHFEPINLTDVTPLWGATSVGGLLVGGVDGLMRVQSSVYSVRVTATGVSGIPAGALDMPRYCTCALLDDGRNELLVVGGRNAGMLETSTASLINLATGDATEVDHAGAASYPVGCTAFFAPAKDLGYVFGGLSGDKQAFSAATHRWDPKTRTMTAIPATGPAGRYDPAVHTMNDGDGLVLSGMGLAGGIVFHQDVWRFDVDTETWSEIETVSTTVPPGRRYGWSALSPDESVLVYGYGSDAPDGSSVLGDMWLFTFATREWAPLDVEGELPAARGFTPNWQIGGVDAGLLVFGTDKNLNVYDDAFVLRVPEAMRGRWH